MYKITNKSKRFSKYTERKWEKNMKKIKAYEKRKQTNQTRKTLT